MPSNYEWTSSKTKFFIKHESPSFEVTKHPFKATIVSIKQSSSKEFIESINKWSSAFEEVDPLLRFEKMSMEENFEPIKVQAEAIDYLKIWNTKRGNILHKYTTGEKLTIVSSFLPGGEKALIKQVSNLNEKVKHRLEQLDEFEEGSERKTMGLSQQEYISKINLLNEEIKKAWGTEQRVRAFKIAIQCSKLLSDTNVMQFYPSKFILITDILENFGELVFNRLKEKSYGNKPIKTIHDIDPNLVPEQAKETCQNWIYKMASIRELLPRLYMEMCLLKCYVFLSKNEIARAIERLTLMIRGVGDPVVAVYLRFYLCRVASRLLGTGCETYFYNNLNEFLEEYDQIFLMSQKAKYESQALPLEKYLIVYAPALDWFISGTLNSNRCKLTLLEELLLKCETMENNELLLHCVVSNFNSENIIKKSSMILDMIHNRCDSMVMSHEILTSLGEHLCKVDSYRQVSSEALIQTWWKLANNIKSPVHFLQVLEPWLEFACKNLSPQHVNIILRGAIRYVIKSGKPADDFSGHFQFVLKRMLKSVPEVEELFLMDAFMPLVELVQTTNARTLMAKTVLSLFFSRHSSDQIEDHIIISGLMRLCCILHDSINAVTVEDEIKVCADLIIKYIQAVSYQDDWEQQLNFYVECRSAFIKLDAVLIALVYLVNALSVRGRGAWLQRACAAYSSVTAPSLRCALTRLQLYLATGQAALLNKCSSQAEANFKALVSLIPDIPEYILEDGQKKPTNTRVEGLLADFLSTLLLLPDNVDSNCKGYVLSGFIKMMERIHWRKTDQLYYNTLLHTLDILCSLTHEDYVYHIESVLSNDELYGSDPEFIDAMDAHATNICQELLVVLKALGDANEFKKQHALCLELLWRIITKGNLTSDSMFNLAINLWKLSQKVNDPQSKLGKSIVATLASSSNPAHANLLRRLKDKTNSV